MDVENLAKELILKNMTPEQQMAVLDSVRQSVANAKEVQKKKIGENVDLVVQALKKIEADIRDRFDAVGNSIEKRVLSIQDGRDGANGKDGRDGRDGKSGKDGIKGDRGIDGQDGRDGIDGTDGISVVNAQIDFDGSLVITLSDGKELNVGEVVSQDIAEKIKVISTMSTNAAIAVKEEGTTLTNGVKSINFVGTGITATTSGDDVTVTVASGSGTVTSVSALTLGTSGTDLSSTVANSTTTPVITLNVPTASATNRGALSSADWTTFNNKGSGTVTSVAATVPAFLSVSGSPITTTGTLAISLSGTALPIANGGTGNATGTATINANLTGDVTSVGNASTLATVNTNVGSFTNASLTVNGKGLITAASSGTAPVTSVTGTSPVVSSGGATPAISLAASYGDTQNPYASKTLKYVLAAPNGADGVPTFRALVASDIPTLNQNTTGSAATLTTPRAIYGNNFDGSAALTQIIASTYGGTGNGFTKFSGATTAERTYTLPDASSTIVVQGGALGTPSSGTVTNLTGTASININGTVGATTASTGAFTTLSATGVTTVQAGTALLPAIVSTTGTADTGIWFPAADTVAASTAGAERIRIDSSGYVTNAVNGNGNGRVLGWQYYRLNAAYAGSNATGAQSLFGVGVTLVGSTVYEFEIIFALSKTAGGNAHTIALGFGGTATVNNIGYYESLAENNTSLTTLAATNDGVVFIQTTSATVITQGFGNATKYCISIVKGTVSINAGGTFIPQYTLSAAPGGAYSTAIGSYIKISALSASGANTSIGTWA